LYVAFIETQPAPRQVLPDKTGALRQGITEENGP
jgi:hypothetical protein